MKNHTDSHIALETLEAEARRFTSLLFAYCEEEQRRLCRPYPLPVAPEGTALAAAALSAHEGIKTFLAVARILEE